MTATRSVWMVVPGEEELGLQRRCVGCGAWLPDADPEFWRQRRPGEWHARCLACDSERRMVTRAAAGRRRGG